MGGRSYGGIKWIKTGKKWEENERERKDPRI